ncbi:MAG: DUF1206 domain-containing protein [Gemmatimonadota bacterium]
MEEIEKRTRPAPGWLDPAARVGHSAKGVVYASVGALALWRSLGGAANATGSREAIRAIAGAPLGRALVAVLVVGLAAYVLWRLSQAILGPDGVGWGRRALYLLSAAIYTALAVFAVQLLLGSGGERDANGASRLAEFMARPRGPWIVGGIGAGLLVRGAFRLSRPYSQDFRDRIGSLELPTASRRWVTSVNRVALTARGIVLLVIGGSLVHAATAQVAVAGRPWMTGLVGACLLILAVLEWTRACYPLPEA